MQGIAILMMCVGVGMAFPSDRAVFTAGHLMLYTEEGTPVEAYVLPILTETSMIEEDHARTAPDTSEVAPGMWAASRNKGDEARVEPEEGITLKTSGNEQSPTGTAPEGSEIVSPAAALRRLRRSQAPINLPGGNQGQQQKNPNGSVGVDVQRSPAGTRVTVDGQHNVHRSRDGNTEVNVHGQYDRTYHGPGATRPNYNAGVRFSHRW